MEKENEKVLASGPKGDETAAGENSNYGTELQKGGGRDELEEREEVEKPPPSPFFYSSKQTPPLSPFQAAEVPASGFRSDRGQRSSVSAPSRSLELGSRVILARCPDRSVNIGGGDVSLLGMQPLYFSDLQQEQHSHHL
ncbi:unnamed protein product [Pleuronectes platessa]|uniref:Uncharacterized protein n=1 Tax=Pleuronectes platessa TaxID=8262 RepID=A0A9N7ZEY0_PLEPL|nr:unnamed protein product [Pleuronectes platessa]